MDKNSDYYQDFLKTLEIKKTELREKKQRNLVASLIMLVVYILVLCLMSFQWKSFTPISINTTKVKSIEEIDSKIATLEGKIKILENNTSTNPSFDYLYSKISSLEKKNSYLYDTILVNPDSAITPKILREEQNNINEKISDLRGRVDTTNNILFQIFCVSLLGIIGYIIKQLWESYIIKHSPLKE